jgi:hypothetical protein
VDVAAAAAAAAEEALAAGPGDTARDAAPEVLDDVAVAGREDDDCVGTGTAGAVVDGFAREAPREGVSADEVDEAPEDPVREPAGDPRDEVTGEEGPGLPPDARPPAGAPPAAPRAVAARRRSSTRVQTAMVARPTTTMRTMSSVVHEEPPSSDDPLEALRDRTSLPGDPVSDGELDDEPDAWSGPPVSAALPASSCPALVPAAAPASFSLPGSGVALSG